MNKLDELLDEATEDVEEFLHEQFYEDRISNEEAMRQIAVLRQRLDDAERLIHAKHLH